MYNCIGNVFIQKCHSNHNKINYKYININGEDVLIKDYIIKSGLNNDFIQNLAKEVDSKNNDVF